MWEVGGGEGRGGEESGEVWSYILRWVGPSRCQEQEQVMEN